MSRDLRVKIDITGDIRSGKSVIATIIKKALIDNGFTNVATFDSELCHPYIEMALTERREEIIEEIKDVRILLVDCNQQMLPIPSQFIETFETTPIIKETEENVNSK